ncbi:hypothetical protein GGG16DRAFT_114566 [Schizophyllum commune]
MLWRPLLSTGRVDDDTERLERATAPRARTGLPHPSPAFRRSGPGLPSPQGDRRKISAAAGLCVSGGVVIQAGGEREDDGLGDLGLPLQSQRRRGSFSTASTPIQSGAKDDEQDVDEASNSIPTPSFRRVPPPHYAVSMHYCPKHRLALMPNALTPSIICSLRRDGGPVDPVSSPPPSPSAYGLDIANRRAAVPQSPPSVSLHHFCGASEPSHACEELKLSLTHCSLQTMQFTLTNFGQSRAAGGARGLF